MLAWVLNTPLLLKDSLNVLFYSLKYVTLRFLKSAISVEYFTSFHQTGKIFQNFTFLILSVPDLLARVICKFLKK